MAKPHTLTTLILEPRTRTGTTAAHALRRAGKIPGVVYGHGPAIPIAVDAKQLTDLVLSGNRSHIVEATVGTEKDSVLLRRIEPDPIYHKPLAVDFQRVTRNEPIVAVVNVVTTGNARGVRDSGAVMDIVAHQLEIKGPAHAIPDSLIVDVTALGLHEHVTAAQVSLPSGFSLISPPDTLVVSVEISRAAVSSGPEELAAAELTETPAAPSE
jgi:large subunit ribosomal protein L25